MAQKLLGHTSMATTLNHYHGVTDADNDQTRAIFDDLTAQTDKQLTMKLSDAG